MLTELNLTGYVFIDGIRRESPIVSTLRASPINGLSFHVAGRLRPHHPRVS